MIDILCYLSTIRHNTETVISVSVLLFLHSQLTALSPRVVYQTAYQDEWQVLGCELVQLRKSNTLCHFQAKKNCAALIPLENLFLFSFKICPKINNRQWLVKEGPQLGDRAE